VPIANIPAEDIALRPELNPIFFRAGINGSDLITLSDLPNPSSRKSLLSPERTRWLLVDHNSLQGDLGQLYSERVVGCIDHHVEEGKVPQDCGSEPRVIEKSGSCASLIVEGCKDVWRALEHDSSDAKKYDSEWAAVALAPVLIDTTNLKDEHKVTKHDLNAAEFLEKILEPSSSGHYDRDESFCKISKAKESIDGLSLNEMLRKDYKQWTEGAGIKLGISSIVRGMDFLVEKAGDEEAFLKELQSFAEDETRKLSICAVMTAFAQDGEFCRELLVLALDEAGIAAAGKFEKESSEALGLKSWDSGRLDKTDDGKYWRRCWVQKRVENSRKQVAPLLRKAIA